MIISNFPKIHFPTFRRKNKRISWKWHPSPLSLDSLPKQTSFSSFVELFVRWQWELHYLLLLYFGVIWLMGTELWIKWSKNPKPLCFNLFISGLVLGLQDGVCLLVGWLLVRDKVLLWENNISKAYLDKKLDGSIPSINPS